MTTNTLFNNLKDLGRKREELRDYCKQKCDEIIKHLPQRILNSDGATVIDCLFNGLPENSVITKSVKTKVIDIILTAFRRTESTTTHCSDVISRVCLELPHCDADDLVHWSNDCVQTIVTDDDVNMIWRDILPECLNALSSHNQVKHCGTQMTSAEYSEKCVTTLCQCRWKEKQLIQLTAMFKDMQLSRDVHRQVVNKLCSYLDDIPIESVPPFLHQLLKLCKTHDIDVVLAYFSEYFKTRLYSKIEPPENDSEATTIDLEVIVMEVFPGIDGITRVAKVNTASGKRLRPFQRLHPLEISHEEINNMNKGQDIKQPVSTRSGRIIKPPERIDL